MTALSRVAPLAAAATLCGCAVTTNATTASPHGCAGVTKATDRAIATRIYDEAARGRVVAGSVARVKRSPSLAAAVANDDPAATRAALRPLMRAQIKRIVVWRGGRVLADVGDRHAIAPVDGTIPGGRFKLSDATASGVAATIAKLTGTHVTISARGAVLVSKGAKSSSAAGRLTVPAAAFAGRGDTIRVTVPSPRRTMCTRADVVGAVGERIYASERGSAKTRKVLGIVARDPGFAQAVARDDAAGLRARIVQFFRDPALHVVRIRAVTASGKLVNDVGGPYVLAPASAPVHWQGRRVGTVTLSVQDDAGFIKLLHRFTGAAVVLRDGGTVVPGSSRTGLRGTPFSFRASRFPSGPLGVSVYTGR